MDHRLALEFLRCIQRQKQAEGYHERAMQSGNFARAMRAARLQEAASARADALIEVTRYRDCDCE